MMENQTIGTFKACAAPKADATTHLDEITRNKCPDLSYFVVFSSISCGRGNAGQPNYGLSNSVMERIVEKRVADGLCGKAIQWGAIGEVGLAAIMTANTIDPEIAGTLLQRISSCLNVMDTLLTTPDPIVGSMVVAKKHSASASGKKVSVIEMVLNIMSIQNMNSISMTTSLSELGMDSLMTIEIKQALEREFEIYLSTQDLRAMTFLTLQELSEADSRSVMVLRNNDLPQTVFDLKGLLTKVANEGEKTIYRLASKSSASEFDNHLLILPGVEGDNRPIWRSVAKQLNVPTFIGKYSEMWEEVSVLTMATKLAKVYFSIDVAM